MTKNLTIRTLVIFIFSTFVFVQALSAQTDDKASQEEIKKISTYVTLLGASPSVLDYGMHRLEYQLNDSWRDFMETGKREGENIALQVFSRFHKSANGFVPSITMDAVLVPWRNDVLIKSEAYAEERCLALKEKLQRAANAIFGADGVPINPFLKLSPTGSTEQEYSDLEYTDISGIIYIQGRVAWEGGPQIYCGSYLND